MQSTTIIATEYQAQPIPPCVLRELLAMARDRHGQDITPCRNCWEKSTTAEDCTGRYYLWYNAGRYTHMVSASMQKDAPLKKK